jgi:WD40 repeat protein
MREEGDAQTGREILSLGHSGELSNVAFSPDGKRRATNGGPVKVWDAATGQPLFSLVGHTSFVESVAFSPDGRTLVSSGGKDEVKLWDCATGREILTFTQRTGSGDTIPGSAGFRGHHTEFGLPVRGHHTEFGLIGLPSTVAVLRASKPLLVATGHVEAVSQRAG